MGSGSWRHGKNGAGGPERVASPVKEFGDAVVGPEGDFAEPQGPSALRAAERIDARVRLATLTPGSEGGGRLGGERSDFPFLTQCTTSASEVVRSPAGREEPAVADHLEVLVGNVAHEPADEGQDRQ